jgi:hypothetical protein
MKKKQHAFVEECADEHRADIIEAIEYGHMCAATIIDTADGFVEIVSGRRGGAAVKVHHDDEENKRECSLLCEAIEKALPEWEDVKEEYEAEEEEAEEEGGNSPDPAFSSWSDYWDYIFRT